MHGWELRAARLDAGLTLAEVARAAGTAQSNVAAYERGDKTPAARTTARLLAAVRAGSASPVHRNQLLTVPAAAAALRHGLRQRHSTADLVRLVRQMVSDSAWLAMDDDEAIFFFEPSTAGDPRWDAMVAGTAEHLALLQRRPAPEWAMGHALRQLWFVGSDPRFDAISFASTPAPLRIRG
ncbi:MAG TPA: helix-turn-helix transcriptional regulator, partial [Acidimicrobiales bacterium]|nr:helix-turn-helix transcriptional regulator [Acidimicrobiales bacterium]